MTDAGWSAPGGSVPPEPGPSPTPQPPQVPQPPQMPPPQPYVQAYPMQPYGQQPYQGQPMPYAGWPAQPPRGGYSGWAIASFVLGILPGVLIAVALGIVGLVTIPRRNQRGAWMAITGIVLGSLWTVFLAIGVVAEIADNSPPGATRTAIKNVTAHDCAAHIDTNALNRVIDVPVLPCDRPHRAEVYALAPLSGDAYPGDDGVAAAADKACSDALTVIGDRQLPSDAEFFYLAPSRSLWVTGQRSALCFVQFGADRTGRLVPG